MHPRYIYEKKISEKIKMKRRKEQRIHEFNTFYPFLTPGNLNEPKLINDAPSPTLTFRKPFPGVAPRPRPPRLINMQHKHFYPSLLCCMVY